MKTFEEVVNEMKSNVSLTKTGKAKKTFSRADYDRMVQALLNDPEYCVQTVGIKNGDIVTTDTYPVKEFRNMIKKVLIDFGVDKPEAETILDSYKFGNSSGMYGLNAASIVEYCKAGKKFDFPTQMDFKASLTIEDVGETTKEYSAIGNVNSDEKFKVTTKEHKTLKSSSKAPKWLKKKFK